MLLLPDYISKEAWYGFVAYRLKLEKATKGKVQWTERAEQIALGKLAEYHEQGYDCNHILDEAVFRSWRGLFVDERTPRTVPRQTYCVERLEPLSPKKQMLLDRLRAYERKEWQKDEHGKEYLVSPSSGLRIYRRTA